MHLVIMGAPGSGKGTQSKRIQVDFGVKHISSGDMLREYAKTDPVVADTIARGELVPFPLVMKLMKHRLSQEDVRTSGFILDGFPRRLEDAIALLEILADLNMPLDALVKLEVPLEELRRRLRGREEGARLSSRSPPVKNPAVRTLGRPHRGPPEIIFRPP
jgi:adenylate kinase